MTHYPLEQWMRLGLAGMAFVVALLLTPRALLDATEQATSHEVPVDMLEPVDDDDCLWCSSLPEDFDDVDCDEMDDPRELQSSSEEMTPDELPTKCRDEIPTLEPSA